MRNGGGARHRRKLASVVLAALASVTGCSSNRLPISGSRGSGGSAAGTGGSVAGQGGGNASDASIDRSDAGSTTGDGATDSGPLSGMVSIDVNPPSQAIALSAAGSSLTGSAVFTATGHFEDG